MNREKYGQPARFELLGVSAAYFAQSYHTDLVTPESCWLNDKSEPTPRLVLPAALPKFERDDASIRDHDTVVI